jgi:hypothetical protein
MSRWSQNTPLDEHLVRVVGSPTDRRVTARFAPNSSKDPSTVVVVCRVGSRDVARPQASVTLIADVTRRYARKRD